MAEPQPPPPDLDDPRAWSDIIDAIGPASMLVLIKRRMGEKLRQTLAPEDVWQEALLHAWRDRKSCAWQGVSAFRRRLLSIIDHRLSDLADGVLAKKRGGDRRALSIEGIAAADGSSSPLLYAGPVASTTPSRVARDTEMATAMERALDALPDDLREAVRLRLFEDLSMEEAAGRLDTSATSFRRRFHRGVSLYYASLSCALGTGPLSSEP